MVPDVYPILKYPEVIKTQRSHHQDHSHSIEESFGESREMSYNSSKESDDCGRLKVEVTDGCANRGTNVHKFNNGSFTKKVHSLKTIVCLLTHLVEHYVSLSLCATSRFSSCKKLAYSSSGQWLK